MQAAAFFMVLCLGSLLAYVLGVREGAIYLSIPPWVYPPLLWVLVVVCVTLPFDVFNRSLRFWALRTSLSVPRDDRAVCACARSMAHSWSGCRSSCACVIGALPFGAFPRLFRGGPTQFVGAAVVRRRVSGLLLHRRFLVRYVTSGGASDDNCCVSRESLTRVSVWGGRNESVRRCQCVDPRRAGLPAVVVPLLAMHAPVRTIIHLIPNVRKI